MPFIFEVIARVVILLFFCAWAVEVVMRLQLGRLLKLFKESMRRAVRLRQYKHASDCWKQRSMLMLSGRLFRISMASAGVLLFAFLPLLIWVALRDPLKVVVFSMTIPGFAIACLGASGYAYLRRCCAR